MLSTLVHTNYCRKMSNQLNIGILLLGISAVMATDDVASIFKQHEVVPDVIAVSPQQYLKVTYMNDLLASKGAELTPTQVQAQPTIEWTGEANAFYTLIMSDPDAPSRTNHTYREMNHWLVGNIPGNNLEKGEVIRAYVGSGPPQGTGLHRYIFLLYKQPKEIIFDEAHVANNSRRDRPFFNTVKFSDKYNLGTPIAGNFYQAQYDDYVPILHKQLSGN